MSELPPLDTLSAGHNAIMNEDGTRLRSDWFALPHAYLTPVTLGVLRDPSVRATIPPLREALEEWRFNDNPDHLITRLTQLPHAHMPIDFVMIAYQHAVSNGYPHMVVDHEPAFSAADNAEAFSGKEEEILGALRTTTMPGVLKTVSLGFSVPGGKEVVLVSGVGDFRLERDMKKKIAVETGLTAAAGKDATINPKQFDTTLCLGLIPGMLKPIVDPALIGVVAGICYIPFANPQDFVALSVSPIDSLVLPVAAFEENLEAYVRHRYDDFSHRKTPDFTFWKNDRPLVDIMSV